MLEITIFPNVVARPQDRAEKDRQSSKVHNDCNTVSLLSTEELIEYVTSYAWSPGVFSDRKVKDDFLYSDFLAYDIDDGMTIEQAEAIVQRLGYICLCLPTPSHKPEHHKFRLIFPLSRRIVGIEEFDMNWPVLAQHFSIDEACKDCSRFYFAGSLEDGFLFEGDKLFEPKKFVVEPAKKLYDRPSDKSNVVVTEDLKETTTAIYGEERTYVPEAVEFFLRNAHTGVPGQWWTSLNNFCFILALQGIEDNVIYSVVEQLAPDPLDKRDLKCIATAIKDGIKASQDNPDLDS